MSDKRKALPPSNSPQFLDRAREALDTYLGHRGDKLDRGVTLRDLIDGGFAQMSARFASTGAGSPVLPAPGLGGTTYTPDLTVPPTPTGMTLTGAISHVLIETDSPIFPAGHGYARTKVYGVKYVTGDPLPTFGNAVYLMDYSGTVGAYPSDPATTWRLWVTWESVDAVESLPAGGVNGMGVTTGQNVTSLLTALTGQITSSQLNTALSTPIAAIPGIQSQQAANTSDIAANVTALNAEIQARGTAIQNEATARQSADSGLAQSITTLTATVGSNTSAIQNEATVRASQTGDLYAQYTVKTDINGYIAGFGLASTANNATPTSSFAVRADEFYIANPTGPTVAPAMPFMVVTTPQTINGQTVPVGVYMNQAFIANGTITSAQIGVASIDDANIANMSVAKLTAGSLAVGQYIQSTNYVAGSSGWRINADGTAEFGAASIRGQITADLIDSRGLSIKDADGNVILAAGTPLNASNISGLGSLATANGVGVGQVYGLSGFATLGQINSSNISTYIANAAIQDAQIANLNAQKLTAQSITTDKLQVGSVSAPFYSSGAYQSISNTTTCTLTFNLGTYTAQGGRLFVYANFSGNMTFSSWANAYMSLNFNGNVTGPGLGDNKSLFSSGQIVSLQGSTLFGIASGQIKLSLTVQINTQNGALCSIAGGAGVRLFEVKV